MLPPARPLPYHEAFWQTVALAAVLLAIAFALIAARARTAATVSIKTAAAVLLVLGTGVLFTIGLSSLAVRRDFARPLWIAIAMGVAVMGLLVLLVADQLDESRAA